MTKAQTEREEAYSFNPRLPAELECLRPTRPVAANMARGSNHELRSASEKELRRALQTNTSDVRGTTTYAHRTLKKRASNLSAGCGRRPKDTRRASALAKRKGGDSGGWEG